MNIQFVVNSEAEGTYNGRQYKGLVIAIHGRKKAVARTFLPDEFSEEKGKTIATQRLHMKLSKAKEKSLAQQYKYIYKMIDLLATKCKTINNKINKEAAKRKVISEILETYL
jgi:hypothetical protein